MNFYLMKSLFFVKFTYFSINENWGGAKFGGGLIKVFLLKRGANKRGGLIARGAKIQNHLA